MAIPVKVLPVGGAVPGSPKAIFSTKENGSVYKHKNGSISINTPPASNGSSTSTSTNSISPSLSTGSPSSCWRSGGSIALLLIALSMTSLSSYIRYVGIGGGGEDYYYQDLGDFASFVDDDEGVEILMESGDTEDDFTFPSVEEEEAEQAEEDEDEKTFLSDPKQLLDSPLLVANPLPYLPPTSNVTSLTPVKPILNLGFPKVGSTSLTNYLSCGSIPGRHHWCGRGLPPCGLCIRNAIADSQPPLQTCGNAQAYLQLDTTFGSNGCYWPQIQALEEMHKEHPHATLLLTFRNVTHWIRSLQHWNGFATRIYRCAFFQPYRQRYPRPNKPEQLTAALEEFYQHHVQRIREFVVKHPTHALLEVDIEKKDAAKRLEGFLGVKEECWGHKNANKRLQVDK